MKKRRLVRDSLLYAVPNIFWLYFLAYLYQNDYFKGIEINRESVALLIIYVVVAFMFTLITVPSLLISILVILMDYASGDAPEYIQAYPNYEVVFTWAFFMYIITIVAAFKYKKGKYLEDSSQVTGYHYETTVESNGSEITATTEKVTDYSGGGEWMINMWLFVWRVIQIGLGGVFIFGASVNEYRKNKKNAVH